MSTISFDDVVAYLSQPELCGNFPSDILRNRLKEMGAQDILEEGSIRSYGFPLKYHHPLDEAILVLHYFLTKSNSIPDSVVHINSIHVPTKEEDNTLSFWKSPKAGLYLDLHSLIENNNRRRLPNANQKLSSGLIQRIFVFRDNAHLAFLESTGIGVILEQQSIGITTGFILSYKQEPVVREMVEGGIVLIQLVHKNNEPCDWAEWALIMDKTNGTNQPYRNQLVCKWYAGVIQDSETPEIENINLNRYRQLFEFSTALAYQKVSNSSYYFERTPTRFSQLLSSNFEAAFTTAVPKIYFEKLKANYDKLLHIKAIPSTLKQFHAALERIRKSKLIRAIDSSSVKSTLKIHESDPNYRHWIRETINLAIHGDVCLERIYILDPSESKGDREIFEQEVNLYLDFLRNKIPRLNEVWAPYENEPPAVSSTNRDNIKLYLITQQKIEEFCRNSSVEKKRELLVDSVTHFFNDNEGNEVTEEDSETMTEEVSSYLSHLDFLYSQELLFNYRDFKGEPGQALYDADLYEPGNPAHNEENVTTFLENTDFEAELKVYERFFELLKSLSVQVLPIAGNEPPNGDRSYKLPPPYELSKQLDDKRVEYFSSLNQERAQQNPQDKYEMANVFFMDIVDYTQLPPDQQKRAAQQLIEFVRSTEELRNAETAQRVIKLPAGDGMALAFFDDVGAGLRCAIEVSRALGNALPLQLRMGLHIGMVSRGADINKAENVSGDGINIANRVMSCGDAGHILASKAVADTLGKVSAWANSFHYLCEVEVKRDRIPIYNVHGDDYGNPAIPEKVRNSTNPEG